ncbi:hypothetical protein MMC08_005820 [Hypocenomyce scalaris]|nr:hypothetical protein [Hypocenomyce scalaris]
MPVTARLVSIPLRIGELAFAATVAGLIGHYLRAFDKADSWPEKRFIYTEVVAGLSILFALIWLLPFSGGFIHYPIDLVLFVAWIVAFGLLVNFIGPLSCGSIWHWGNITEKGTCERWKAAVAFSFLSAIFWLVSALVGIWFIHRARRNGNVVRNDGTNVGTSRRKWYRSSRV